MNDSRNEGGELLYLYNHLGAEVEPLLDIFQPPELIAAFDWLETEYSHDGPTAKLVKELNIYYENRVIDHGNEIHEAAAATIHLMMRIINTTSYKQ